MKSSPKTLQIYLPEGTPSGIQIAELTTRIVQAVSIPRTKLKTFFDRNNEANHIGTYFLFGSIDDSSKPKAYIGQTEDLRQRLKQHDSDQKKEFWTTAVVLISRTHSFTQAHIRWLEWYAIKRANEANRYHLENGNNGSEPHVTEAIQADLVEIFDTGKLLLQSLGFPIFEPLVYRTDKSIPTDLELWYCKGPDANAVGTITENGMVVLKGSKSRKKFVQKEANGPYAKKVAQHLSDSVLFDAGDSFEYAEDVVYGSPSYAATVVLGRRANGWLEWKNEKGQSLDQIKRKDN